MTLILTAHALSGRVTVRLFSQAHSLVFPDQVLFFLRLPDSTFYQLGLDVAANKSDSKYRGLSMIEVSFLLRRPEIGSSGLALVSQRPGLSLSCCSAVCGLLP